MFLFEYEFGFFVARCFVCIVFLKFAKYAATVIDIFDINWSARNYLKKNQGVIYLNNVWFLSAGNTIFFAYRNLIENAEDGMLHGAKNVAQRWKKTYAFLKSKLLVLFQKKHVMFWWKQKVACNRANSK